MVSVPGPPQINATESALVDELAIRYPEHSRRAIREQVAEVVGLHEVHELSPATIIRVVEARLLADL